jgi:hypothetical protein
MPSAIKIEKSKIAKPKIAKIKNSKIGKVEIKKFKIKNCKKIKPAKCQIEIEGQKLRAENDFIGPIGIHKSVFGRRCSGKTRLKGVFLGSRKLLAVGALSRV